MGDALLDIKGLSTVFNTELGVFPAIKDVNLSLRKGETLCVVGESGSGKTITSMSLMQLLPPSGKIASGEIIFRDVDLVKLTRKEINRFRGKAISMIFQDPMSALDPVYTCGSQITEAIQIHKKISKGEAKNRAIQLLKQVGIPHPETIFDAYPHELSGGMCQRVMIAMALSCNPELLIADEPTTALDVTVQARILDLLNKIKKEFNMGILLITHDLGVVAEMADRVAVMYAGQIVEETDVHTLFKNPKHPYTKGLIKSVPPLHHQNKTLYSIPGSVPSISSMPNGCRFHPRCSFATDLCVQKEPELQEIKSQHKVKCWHIDEGV
ncbi:ABC transporter ATP-binding protein [Bacillus sp. MRMR6]|uniref:ABC transporter ATP-binding protein n=1 Tax=Bacillus sp. MRMR6 TaxID=1928617 RepID=UPI000951A39E|nr:ABC transporter ATP-binding protein [Bacillus sp. MRMR6]OLS35421.1 peptide ABC transporter ATP-binding protein [Bacillus sp. MRMR6]